jgi:hypothetical protein
MVKAAKTRGAFMKSARVAAALAVLATPLSAYLARPAYAQMPNINLLADAPSKTDEEKEAETARDRAYKDTLKKIPDAKASNDPWGVVRTPSTPAKPEPKAAKTIAAGKKTRAGSNAN